MSSHKTSQPWILLCSLCMFALAAFLHWSSQRERVQDLEGHVQTLSRELQDAEALRKGLGEANEALQQHLHEMRNLPELPEPVPPGPAETVEAPGFLPMAASPMMHVDALAESASDPHTDPMEALRSPGVLRMIEQFPDAVPEDYFEGRNVIEEMKAAHPEWMPSPDPGRTGLGPGIESMLEAHPDLEENLNQMEQP